ncbi:ATP-binding cassette domain-containing protein [Sporichthya sp.]|uniref:ATP-binding cassette domain-containing protein n=1 Tax=Sporichthya sp. TaxID=65475 RepID=UPI0025F49636|nr:ATP-binding cassette domain-containing protein [Sporichthya sp.]
MTPGIQRACLWSGPIFVAVFFGGILAAGWLPPPEANQTASEIADMYNANTDGIRMGAALIAMSSFFQGVWADACTGLLRPTSGTVHLFGEDVTGTTPHHRAQKGLGRTFQRMELFDSLTVRDNVSLGREAGLAGSKPWRHILGKRSDAATVASAVEEAIDACGISELIDRRPADLSTGQRRLVELARCMAGGFQIMLLDEPSSGPGQARDQALRGDPALPRRRPRRRDPHRRARHGPGHVHV